MDDRLQKIRLNNPILLHFYSPEELLPNPESTIIAILRNEYAEYKHFGKYRPVFSTGADFIKAYEDENNDCHNEIVAWASFSPEWVISSDLSEV